MNQETVQNITYVVNRVFSADQQTAKDLIMKRAEANRALTNRQSNIYNSVGVIETPVLRREAT